MISRHYLQKSLKTQISCTHIAINTLDRSGSNIIALTISLALNPFIFTMNICSKDINAPIARTTNDFCMDKTSPNKVVCNQSFKVIGIHCTQMFSAISIMVDID